MSVSDRLSPAAFFCRLTPACYVYGSEIFPTTIRAQGVAWTVSWFFLLSALWTGVAPNALAAIGWRFYIGERWRSPLSAGNVFTVQCS